MGFKRPRVRISTLGLKNPEQLLLFWIFYFCVERFEHLNAARVSAAGDGSTEPHNNFSSYQEEKC